VTRQTGSHVRLTSTVKGREHHISIPRHKAVRVGTLSAVLREIGTYLEMEREELSRRLFAD
jgi:predicted RNA binding protein YcfA (HicA-like mRNA interferase family)